MPSIHCGLVVFVGNMELGRVLPAMENNEILVTRIIRAICHVVRWVGRSVGHKHEEWPNCIYNLPCVVLQAESKHDHE